MNIFLFLFPFFIFLFYQVNCCVDLLFVIDTKTAEISKNRAIQVAKQIPEDQKIRKWIAISRQDRYVPRVVRNNAELLSVLSSVTGEYDRFLDVVTSEVARRTPTYQPLIILLFSDVSVNETLSSSWKRMSRAPALHIFRIGTSKKREIEEASEFRQLISCGNNKPSGPETISSKFSGNDIRRAPIPLTTTRPLTSTRDPFVRKLTFLNPTKTLLKDRPIKRFTVTRNFQRITTSTYAPIWRRYRLTTSAPRISPQIGYATRWTPNNRNTNNNAPIWSSTAQKRPPFRNGDSRITNNNNRVTGSNLGFRNRQQPSFRNNIRLTTTPRSTWNRFGNSKTTLRPFFRNNQITTRVFNNNRNVLRTTPRPRFETTRRPLISNNVRVGKQKNSITTSKPTSTFRPFTTRKPLSTTRRPINRNPLNRNRITPQTQKNPTGRTVSGKITVRPSFRFTTHRPITTTKSYFNKSQTTSKPSRLTTKKISVQKSRSSTARPRLGTTPTTRKFTKPTPRPKITIKPKANLKAESKPSINKSTPKPKAPIKSSTSKPRFSTTTSKSKTIKSKIALQKHQVSNTLSSRSKQNHKVTPPPHKTINSKLRSSTPVPTVSTVLSAPPPSIKEQFAGGKNFRVRSRSVQFTLTEKPPVSPKSLGFNIRTHRSTLVPPTTTPFTPPACIIDVYFMIDLSKGTGDKTDKYLQIISTAVNQMPISKYATHAGIIGYSGPGRTRTDVYLDQIFEKKTLISEMNKLWRNAGTTKTANALRYAVKEFNSKAHPSRKNSKKVLVIFTDGYSQDNPKEAAKVVKSRGIQIIAVALNDKLAPPDVEQLKSIAESNVLLSPTGKELRDKIIGSQCRL